ncbi:MAG: amidohydrolase [Gemmatimonadota bacterium]|nr:amidohydrolase [Gemmatimonadota bacterium]MDE2863538.1 amidohydrolase [Gemmatimonadota bacterium]
MKRRLRSRFHLLLPAVLILAVFWRTPVGGQSVEEGKDAALAHAADLDGLVAQMSNRLWDFAEIALEEHQSAGYLAEVLEDEGFTVETGIAGMPTAFIASWGSGRPILGVLAEYDALPNIGNAAQPGRAPRDDGHIHGHGCGHNLFGAASVGAAIAIKRMMAEHGTTGTVRLYGTPAEETVVGKVYMARDGLFDDLDASIVWHPGQRTAVSNSRAQALNNFEVSFRGQAAHGAADPWNGRSALDAVELMNHGVNMMREHIEPSARVHYVIPNAGEAPNVVPEYARAWYYVRDTTRAAVEENYEWILDIAAGAAQMTRTEHEVFLITGVHTYTLIRPLQEAMQANLERVGPPRFDEADQAFARELQGFLEVEQSGLRDTIDALPDVPTPAGGGSSDVAEVSYITPTVEFSVTTAAEHIPWHSWATSASHGTSGAVKGAQVATKALALMGAELILDAALVRRAREAHAEATGGVPYRSPIPEGQQVPLPTRD